MATLYRRGDCYYLNWYEGGRQRRKSLGRISAQDAERKRIVTEARTKGAPVQAEYSTIAFGRFLADDYLPWHRAKFPDSHFRVKQICEQAFGDFLGLSLPQITRQGVERWLAGRETRVGFNRHKDSCVVSSETATKELRTLKAALNKAVEWGKIAASPASAVKAPKNKRSSPVHYYSKDELQKLYEHTELAPVWRLMVNTGMRRAEALQLKWENVHEDHLDVLSTEDERTKSGKWRQIPLTVAARQSLDLLRLQAEGRAYVLPRTTGSSLSRAFLRDCERLGLKGSLHSLRHSYGAHLVMAGVPLRTVQHLMGHASFTTTERYAHVGKDHLRDQARLVSL